LLALQGLVVFALSGCSRESAKKEKDRGGTEVDQKKKEIQAGFKEVDPETVAAFKKLGAESGTYIKQGLEADR
jgi:hypothetical protein